ncbi:hypothetical protein FV228_03050 [Methylobacterium sp. WL18]|nr:hypothetical protein FV228_03050 [Methylobacterium sp. WL18]
MSRRTSNDSRILHHRGVEIVVLHLQSSNEAATEQIVAHLMREALIEFAVVIRNGSSTEARNYLATLEQRLAAALLRVWQETSAGRSRPDLIAAVALRLRELIREGDPCGSQMGRAA